VIVTAPAAFLFTYEAAPDRHRRAAELLVGRPLPDANEYTLPELLLALMRDVGAATGLRQLGYDEGDVDALVQGALKQQRLLVVAPREASADDLAQILRASL
jgi:hydroxyacid-oxoacid transhydrogenase